MNICANMLEFSTFVITLCNHEINVLIICLVICRKRQKLEHHQIKLFDLNWILCKTVLEMSHI